MRKRYLTATTRYVLPALLAVLALAMIAAPDALAQFGLDEAAGSKIPKTKDVAVIISRILGAAVGFVGTLFLLLMIYAGFLWMTARGDAKKVDQAKQLITGAVIGVVLIAGAYAITSFVIGAVTGTGTAAPEATGNIADGSVATGGTCGDSADCSETTDICEDNKCVSTLESP